MKAQLPEKWKWHSIEKYDGLLDPKTHIKAYLTKADTFYENFEVHCRLFPSTFKGLALEWYYSFPKNSIDSFDAFCARLSARCNLDVPA